jgi:hypothetical protein
MDDGMSEAVSPDPLWEAPARRFPATRLFAGIGLALDGRKLLLALLGLLVTYGGWALLDRALPATADVTPAFSPRVAAGPLHADAATLRRAGAMAAEPIRLAVAPARAVFAIGGGSERFAHGLIGLAWAGLVWTLFGGAIARLAVIEAATGERRGMMTGLGFAARKAGSLAVAPLIPVAGVGFLVGVLALFGLLYRPAGPALGTVAGVLGFLPLLLGLVLMWLLVGLAAGWPLMVASVAAEAEDSFDALSRSFSYVFQRPVLLAGLVAVAWAVGAAGVLVVEVLVRLLLHLTAWALAFGAPDAGIAGRFGPTAEGVHAGWYLLVVLLAHAFAFAYAWSAAAQIYLLVRHEVDGTPIEDVAARSQEAGDDDAGTAGFAPEPPPAPPSAAQAEGSSGPA